MPYVTPGKTLDVGCGSGRNALYLALQGFTIDAVDLNPQSLAKLQYIKSQENLDTLTINQVDLNKPFQIKPAYDFILSTVVLMFLQRQSIQPLIEQMQKATKTGGHNLIVAAMDTHDYPCKAPFPFTFRPNELKNHYQDWTLIKYNEDVGHLHKKDECGNPIALRFATLLAKKVN